jgi:hypothetical protein
MPGGDRQNANAAMIAALEAGHTVSGMVARGGGMGRMFFDLVSR